jgi:hypothetical protein
MNSGPEVKAPLSRSGESGGSEDWRIHLYNQERMLAGQEQITLVLEKLLEQQRLIGGLAVKLDEHLEISSKVMQDSTNATKGLVGGIIKVPIVIVTMVIASAAHYVHYISENTWLIIMAVALFPYLGESITAVFKLVRGQQTTNSGADGK